MAAKISLVTDAGSRVGRTNRNPRHQFLVNASPWEIVPFFIAPVLAGETMKGLLMQGTTKMEGVKPALSGWWQETFFFYVKHRDLAARDLLAEMHVANASTASLEAGANSLYFHAVGIPWMQMCYQRIVEEYFRDEGEPFGAATSSNGYALARLDRSNFLDSAILDGFTPDTDEDQLPGDELHNSLYEAHAVPAGYEAHFDTWLQMRRARLVAVDFEDYLKAHGIRVAKDKVDPHRPELVRYEKDWQTPRPWYVPYTGEPAASLTWTQSIRADKDRFFDEPGFLVGLSVIRPKVLIAGISGSAVGLLKDAFTWLPAMLNSDPETSLIKVSNATAKDLFPNYEGTEEVWIDVKDLFVHGEDYTNIGPASNGTGIDSLVALDDGPDTAFHRRYPSSALFDLFISPQPITPGDPEAEPPVDPVYPDLGPVGRQSCAVSEGIVSLTIASRITDTSGAGNQMV